MARPETVFVVEDDILYLNLINKELEKMGYTKIESYTTGKEAMNNLDKKPDIALLDYFLEKDFTGMDI
ncbi:MAG: response regulator, partial [Bacteroidetes bacterium]|nr:response regulator [Bacteroidota bacterium]